MTDALELIGQIYDAAFDPALWPDVLVHLADAVGGAEVCMFDYAPRAHCATLVAPRHDPGYVQVMRNEWMPREFAARSNTFGRRLVRAPAGRVLDAHELVPDGFYGTDFYNEWWRPQGLSLFGIGTKWRLEPDELGFCFVHGPSRSGGIEIHNARLFGLIVPHLVRAAGIHHRLLRMKLEQASAQTGQSVADNGVIFVDAAARVIYANDRAADLICARDGLLVDGSELTTVDMDASASLRRLIAGCANRRLTERGPGGAVSVRRGDRLPLQIAVAPIRAERWQDREPWLGVLRPAAILVVNDPELERQMRMAHLRKKFGLTAAETLVALEISRGDGRDAAAARLGITCGTVRIHLQRIFDKAGVHRQAKLVRLLADAGDADCSGKMVPPA
jgi:DNA-binding CsgD family transcriptional regulator